MKPLRGAESRRHDLGSDAIPRAGETHGARTETTRRQMTGEPKPIFVRAASYLGAAGYGNLRTGLQRWPETIHSALARGDVEAVHWSDLFASDPQRFARMDPLCRLGLMAVEFLADAIAGLGPAALTRVGVAVETAAGCATTDARFLKTPRPSLFAYTLPSTLLGEICIRHRFQGPQLCLLSPDGEGRQILEEAMDWLRTGCAEWVVCLGCEALDGSAASMLSPRLTAAWQAHALLLGLGPMAGGMEVARESSVRQVWDKLCIDIPEVALQPPSGSSTSQ